MVAFRTQRQHEQNRRLLRENEQLLEEQHRGRIRPVQILDREHDGRLLRKPCE